jgi:hypothetical protein
MVSLEFFGDIIPPDSLGPGVDSVSNRNEYQVYFLGVKCDRCIRLTTLPPSCAVVMKSRNLNFLEPSGPLQACNGTAAPFFTLHEDQYTFLLNLAQFFLEWKMFQAEVVEKLKTHILCRHASPDKTTCKTNERMLPHNHARRLKF